MKISFLIAMQTARSSIDKKNCISMFKIVFTDMASNEKLVEEFVVAKQVGRAG